MNNKAFTLLEIMVATSIMAILLTVIMVNYRAYEKKSKLDSESQKMVSVLKRAQMMALSGKETAGSRPEGYGIYFSGNASYFLFGAVNDGNYTYQEGSDIKIENFNLPANMTMTAKDNGNNINNIVFTLPEAKVYFEGSEGIGDVTITFQSAGVSNKIVTIKGETGRIE